MSLPFSRAYASTVLWSMTSSAPEAYLTRVLLPVLAPFQLVTTSASTFPSSTSQAKIPSNIDQVVLPRRRRDSRLVTVANWSMMLRALMPESTQLLLSLEAAETRSA